LVVVPTVSVGVVLVGVQIGQQVHRPGDVALGEEGVQRASGAGARVSRQEGFFD
jgi:hypothetical protein